ncbi:site-specific recombinase [Crenobacter cavernae]|uniref:Recombinase n=1 Tax=Crenobacter cavernae TaxID=2290923 RepID=A0A345Y437_9NEIS|nr:site-specific recombinase [Crenobacter cavernae]AXK38689.1 recombinase [Crenobacter cavernae]
MDEVLKAMCLPDAAPAPLLARLIAALRPDDADDVEQATKNVRALTFLLNREPDYRAALRSALLNLMGGTRQVALYTDVGTLSNEGFYPAFKRRVGERLLPPAKNPEYLKDVFGELFADRKDHRWVAALPRDVWSDLWRALAWGEEDGRVADHTRLQLLEAVQVLTARISAIGLEPELVRVVPEIERFESPFLHLGAETLRYSESYREALMESAEPAEDEKQLLVLLDQCEDILARAKKNAARYGISVGLTYHVLRLKQHIDRMRMLLDLLNWRHDPAEDATLFLLLAELVRADNRKYSVRDLFTENTELIALQVTEHAGRHGEHYIAETRTEWSGMARAAAGAGLIVGFMALIKLLLGKAHLPLIWEALAFGLNYSLGFMLVHVLHFTIATKQPAMTAARIAAAIHDKAGGRAWVDELTELVVKVLRTQFVAILGNVLLAIPTAWAIAEAWRYITGAPVIDAAKARHLLADLNPVASLALFHAAIAGVYLFLAGLIAGYYDNLAIYRRIPERIAALPWLNRVLGERRTLRLSRYIEDNLGGLAGNFYFGMFLGVTGTIGFLLGLPLDIRHITFSSAYLSFASVTLDYQLSMSVLLWSVAGIALVGMTNLLVSFSLALWVALRSRKLRAREALPLVPAVIRRFFRSPLSFILPPPKAVPGAAAEQDPA